MAKATQKTRLETAQENLKNSVGTQEPPKTYSTNSQSNTQTNTASIDAHGGDYGGVKLPVFDPNTYLAGDLFSDSSTLPQTTRVNADKAIQSISEKRETVRVLSANLQLNADVIKAGGLAEKMNQAAITYGTDRVNTDTKLVGFENSKINYQIATTKLEQTSVKLTHEGITLEGLKAETEQRQRFWKAKYDLAESRIKQVELAKYQLEAKIGSIEAEAEVLTE